VNDKWWSLLFGTVMLGCTALFVVAPFVGWWLPLRTSSHAQEIDDLFYQILWITGFFFLLTEGILICFMYMYSAREPGEVRGRSMFWPIFKPVANLFNTATKIEMAWTIVPSVILVYVAYAQVDAWQAVKYQSRLDKIWGVGGTEIPVQVELSARQFEWRFRYPSVSTWKQWKQDPTNTKATAWVKTPNFDDVHVPNDLHIINNRHCVVQLSTKDVIHSFNSAHMRVKQDALPGKIIPVWFQPTVSNVHKVTKDGKVVAWQDGKGRDQETNKPNDSTYVWDIACAELCGWGHYRMVGKIFVHENEADWLAWLESASAHQQYFGTPPASK
jgi:cytochrome c oxidase subunit II